MSPPPTIPRASRKTRLLTSLRGRSERHSNADFVRSPRHRIGQQPVESDSGKRGAEHAEKFGQRCDQPFGHNVRIHLR